MVVVVVLQWWSRRMCRDVVFGCCWLLVFSMGFSRESGCIIHVFVHGSFEPIGRKAILPVVHLFGALLDQVHINFCCCIDDGALNNVFRCFMEWVDNSGKLQSFTLAHQFGMVVVGGFG